MVVVVVGPGTLCVCRVIWLAPFRCPEWLGSVSFFFLPFVRLCSVQFCISFPLMTRPASGFRQLRGMDSGFFFFFEFFVSFSSRPTPSPWNSFPGSLEKFVATFLPCCVLRF